MEVSARAVRKTRDLRRVGHRIRELAVVPCRAAKQMNREALSVPEPPPILQP